MSATAADGSRPSSWTGFLAGLITLIENDADRQAAERLLGERAFLDCAQVVADAVPAKRFSAYVLDSLDKPGFQPSELHQAIGRLDPKIVVTTNYDDIYERYLASAVGVDEFVVRSFFEPHLIDDVRSNRRVIAKVHGTVAAAERVILTRNQYFDARRRHGDYYSVLDALFLTRTLLFVGLGFHGDPDIDLLLQNANIAAPAERPHYALVPDGRHHSVMKALTHTYNVEFLQYPAGDHQEVVDALVSLANEVDGVRLPR